MNVFALVVSAERPCPGQLVIKGEGGMGRGGKTYIGVERSEPTVIKFAETGADRPRKFAAAVGVVLHEFSGVKKLALRHEDAQWLEPKINVLPSREQRNFQKRVVAEKQIDGEQIEVSLLEFPVRSIVVIVDKKARVGSSVLNRQGMLLLC